MVTEKAEADESLRDGDHTHWACKQKARLFIPARARLSRSRAWCSRWAMPGAGRATKRFLCAVRLWLRDSTGETEVRRGARGGAQGEAAIWQVQPADPERSARTAELQAPRARPADIRARRSRPPRQRPQIGGALAPRGPAGRALARALLSPPLGRAPRCRRASSALVEPGAGGPAGNPQAARAPALCARLSAWSPTSLKLRAPPAAAARLLPGDWRPESRPSPSPEPAGRLRGRTSSPPGGVLTPRVPAAR